MKTKTFTINGKKYACKPVTFNAICDFEDMGMPIEEMFEKKMKGIRVYLAYCGNMDVDTAGAEIEAHMMGGNNIADLSNAMIEAITESGFFHALQTAEEEEEATSQTEEKVTEIPEK